MEINETPLPGLGLRYDFGTVSGQKVAVIAHHTGRRDIYVYDEDDPDAARDLLSLTEDEANDLGELLGAARIAGPLADLQQRIQGLAIDWITISPQSRFVGRPLGDTQARTRTGVSIVAVVRDEEAFPAPRPDFVFQSEDVLVAIGTSEGLRTLALIVEQ